MGIGGDAGGILVLLLLQVVAHRAFFSSWVTLGSGGSVRFGVKDDASRSFPAHPGARALQHGRRIRQRAADGDLLRAASGRTQQVTSPGHLTVDGHAARAVGVRLVSLSPSIAMDIVGN